MINVPAIKSGISALAVFTLGVLAAAGEPPPEASHAFKITIAGKMHMDTKDGKQNVDVDSELHYTWNRKGTERIVTFDQLLTRAAVNGKETLSAIMTPKKVTTIANGKKNETAIEDAPEALKTFLSDSLGTPICKFQVDENGKEVKRTIVARPGAKKLLQTGMIANSILFHPPYYRGKDMWEAPAEVTLGTGGYVRGKLTYDKDPRDKGGKTFKVTGTLTTDSFKGPDTPLTCKDVKYVVNGKEVYDTTYQEWVSGEIVIDVRYEMTLDDKHVASASGKMSLKFERLPEKK